eukprot:tig00020571_g11487.t1
MAGSVAGKKILGKNRSRLEQDVQGQAEEATSTAQDDAAELADLFEGRAAAAAGLFVGEAAAADEAFFEAAADELLQAASEAAYVESEL